MAAVLVTNKYVLMISLEPFKSYYAVHRFIASMIKKIKYWSRVMKKYFNKNLL